MTTRTTDSDSGPQQCRGCGYDFAVLAGRQNLLDRVLALVYIYPFRCHRCTHRFRMMRWRVRDRRHSAWAIGARSSGQVR